MTLTLARAATTPRAPRPAQPSARHLVHVLPGFGVGGIQIRLARLINALGGRFRHTILTINGQDGCRDRLDPALGVAIEAAPVKGGLFSRVDADAQRLASLRPDLLLTYNWGAIEWAMANRLLAHRRHIHAEDGFGPEEAERQLRRRIMLRRWALRRAETLIVPSRTLESIAIAQWRLPPERVRYVPNSIDADDFAATAAGAPLFARAADEIVIGTVAPLRLPHRPEEKHAFAEVLASGEGFERGALRAIAGKDEAQGCAGRDAGEGADEPRQILFRPQRRNRANDDFIRGACEQGRTSRGCGKVVGIDAVWYVAHAFGR